VSFVLRFWLEEDSGRRFWRARVVEVDGARGVHVEDGSALVAFVGRRLTDASGVRFPLRRRGGAHGSSARGHEPVVTNAGDRI